FNMQRMIARAQAAEASEKQGLKPTEEQQDAKKEWDQTRKRRNPDAEAIRKDAEAWRGNIASVVKARAKLVSRWHAIAYYHPWNLDVWSMMFIGMGLMKLGVFSATRSHRFYGWLAAIGYTSGILVNSYTAWLSVRSNFDATVHTFTYTT